MPAPVLKRVLLMFGIKMAKARGKNCVLSLCFLSVLKIGSREWEDGKGGEGREEITPSSPPCLPCPPCPPCPPALAALLAPLTPLDPHCLQLGIRGKSRASALPLLRKAIALLKLSTQRCPREGDHIADIPHTCHKLHQPLKSQAKPSVRYSTIAT